MFDAAPLCAIKDTPLPSGSQCKALEASKLIGNDLSLVPSDTDTINSAMFCEALLAAPTGNDGKLTVESLSKLHRFMQQLQRPVS